MCTKTLFYLDEADVNNFSHLVLACPFSVTSDQKIMTSTIKNSEALWKRKHLIFY